MKNFIKSTAFKALTAVALFLVGIMIYAASTSGVATIPEILTGAIVTPIQSLGSAISDGFNNFIGIFTDSNILREENNKLQSEINDLRRNQVGWTCLSLMSFTVNFSNLKNKPRLQLCRLSLSQSMQAVNTAILR